MSSSISKTLQTGSFAPDFVLKNQHNEIVRLSDFRNKKNVVLFFYPKDDTPGCTAEVKCFRDKYEQFIELGAEVIGISSDSIAEHIKFADKHKLPYTLLSDHSGKVRELYGVSKTFFLIPGRMTFVIDKQGIIRYMFSSQFNPTKHIEESLKILQSI